MYAVIATSGRQFRVTKGAVIKVNAVEGNVGDNLSFNNVVAIGDEKSLKASPDELKKASVNGTILEQGRADKIIIFKKKRRKGYQKKQGHRQNITTIRITDISS
jgi:large subunit ribosomal protein L21